jgi:hypothetical protein
MMTGKKKKPAKQRPDAYAEQAEQPQPGQQMADDGSGGGAAHFGNIQPVEGEDPPGGNEVGGG